MNKELFLKALSSNDLIMVKNYLKNEQSFAIFYDGVMLKLGNVSIRIDIDSIALYLLEQTYKYNAELIYNHLNNFMKADEIQGIDILAINGVQVDQPVELSNDVSLIPYTLLPDSYGKMHYNPISISDEINCPKHIKYKLQLYKVFNPNVQNIFPTAALICSNISKPKFSYNDSQNNHSDFYQLRLNELLDACKCLTLISMCSPTPVGAWWEAKDWVPHSPWNSFGGNGVHFDLINTTIYNLNESDKQDIKKIYNLYNLLDKDIKNKLDIAIDRLNRAKRRIQLVDSCIELGIAMETIFLDEISNSELSYRLKLNAAALLGDNYLTKKNMMKLFDDLYKCRSNCVHNGSLPKNIKSPEKLVANGIQQLANAIKIIINDNKWPDWDELLLNK